MKPYSSTYHLPISPRLAELESLCSAEASSFILYRFWNGTTHKFLEQAEIPHFEEYFEYELLAEDDTPENHKLVAEGMVALEAHLEIYYAETTPADEEHEIFIEWSTATSKAGQEVFGGTVYYWDYVDIDKKLVYQVYLNQDSPEFRQELERKFRERQIFHKVSEQVQK